MKQKTFVYLLTGVITLFVSVFSACTEDECVERTPNKIVVGVNTDGDFSRSRNMTRGTKVEDITTYGLSAAICSSASSYTSVGCGSYFFNELATNGVALDYFWPTSDYKVSFFGYYPRGNAAFTMTSTANSTGSPTYSYTVPSAVASQVDVMTGQTVDVLGGGSSPVTLTMKHRCTAVNFKVTNSRASAVTLTSVSINGVKYTGTLTGDTWTLGSSTSNFPLAYGSSIAAGATANVTGTTNIFLMLPQTIPSGAKIKAVIDGSEELEAELAGAWAAGKNYTYSIIIEDNGLIVDPDTEITDWTEETKNISVGTIGSGNSWSQPTINGGEGVGAEDWTEEE